ncbi:MAG: hypothetical protein ABJD53_15845 [Gammaproteobacteria bacterium]
MLTPVTVAVIRVAVLMLIAVTGPPGVLGGPVLPPAPGGPAGPVLPLQADSNALSKIAGAELHQRVHLDPSVWFADPMRHSP